jgi:hypothetical protein
MPNKNVPFRGRYPLFLGVDNSSLLSCPVTSIETPRLVEFGVPFHLIRQLTDTGQVPAVPVRNTPNSSLPIDRRAVK